MAISRYANAPVMGFGQYLGTSNVISSIRAAIKSGALPVTTVIVRGRERLDTIAGEVYGDGKLWWVLAAASNIGWGLQVPPGTVISVPELNAVMSFLT
jgi:nucleoid-associated protein YgaU